MTTDLPDLPRKLNKREARITPKVIKWLVDNNIESAFEIKVSKTNTIPRSALKEHQRKALLKVKHGTFAYKIVDVGKIRLPFDGFVLIKKPAYVIACFSKNNRCFIIDVEDWKGCRIDEKQYKSFKFH